MSFLSAIYLSFSGAGAIRLGSICYTRLIFHCRYRRDERAEGRKGKSG